MNEVPDKQILYGRYQDGEDRRTKLALKMAHKALDIPDDDMNIDASRNQTGIGTAGVLGAVLGAGGLGVAGTLLGMFLNREPAAAPVQPKEQPAVVAPATPAKGQTWDITIKRMWKDGKWVEDATVKPVQEK